MVLYYMAGIVTGATIIAAIVIIRSVFSKPEKASGTIYLDSDYAMETGELLMYMEFERDGAGKLLNQIGKTTLIEVRDTSMSYKDRPIEQLP